MFALTNRSIGRPRVCRPVTRRRRRNLTISVLWSAWENPKFYLSANTRTKRALARCCIYARLKHTTLLTTDWASNATLTTVRTTYNDCLPSSGRLPCFVSLSAVSVPVSVCLPVSLSAAAAVQWRIQAYICYLHAMSCTDKRIVYKPWFDAVGEIDFDFLRKRAIFLHSQNYR